MNIYNKYIKKYKMEEIDTNEIKFSISLDYLYLHMLRGKDIFSNEDTSEFILDPYILYSINSVIKEKYIFINDTFKENVLQLLTRNKEELKKIFKKNNAQNEIKILTKKIERKIK